MDWIKTASWWCRRPTGTYKSGPLLGREERPNRLDLRAFRLLHCTPEEHPAAFEEEKPAGDAANALDLVRHDYDCRSEIVAQAQKNLVKVAGRHRIEPR